MNKAVEWGHLPKNPLMGVKKEREAEAPMRILSSEEKKNPKCSSCASEHARGARDCGIGEGRRQAVVPAAPCRSGGIALALSVMAKACKRGPTSILSFP